MRAAARADAALKQHRHEFTLLDEPFEGDIMGVTETLERRDTQSTQFCAPSLVVHRAWRKATG